MKSSSIADAAFTDAAVFQESGDVYGNMGAARKRLLRMDEIGSYIRSMKTDHGSFEREYKVRKVFYTSVTNVLIHVCPRWSM